MATWSKCLWQANNIPIGHGLWVRSNPMYIVVEYNGPITIREYNCSDEPLGEVIVGPFESEDAAKVAYLLLME